MRFEEMEVRNRLEAVKKAGTSAGQLLAGMINRLEHQGAISDRPASEDVDLIEMMLEAIAESKHFSKKHGHEYQEQDVFKAAARVVFAADLKAAERDLRFAERAFMDHYWLDRLEDLEAADRETARAS